MNILNGEPFVKYQLDSIYNFAHEIIIVEGAYEKFSHAAENYRSKDNTISVIEDYDDRENKIKLIVHNKYYTDRLDMCNELLKHVTGDIIWQIDVDEFYLPDTHLYVREIFLKDPEVDVISFNFKDYYINTSFCITGYEELGLTNVNRVHRYNQGEVWCNQRPPTLALPTGELKTIRKKIEGDQLEALGHVMHHATMIFNSQIVDKYKYYSKMWKSVSKPTTWYQDTWCNFENKFNIAGFNSHITFLLENKGTIPHALEELFSDVDNGKLPGFSVRDEEKVRLFIKSELYYKYLEIAKLVNRVGRAKPSELIYIYFKVIIGSFLVKEWKSFTFLHYVLHRKLVGRIILAIRRRIYD